jgi:hypothetical protein
MIPGKLYRVVSPDGWKPWKLKCGDIVLFVEQKSYDEHSIMVSFLNPYGDLITTHANPDPSIGWFCFFEEARNESW